MPRSSLAAAFAYTSRPTLTTAFRSASKPSCCCLRKAAIRSQCCRGAAKTTTLVVILNECTRVFEMTQVLSTPQTNSMARNAAKAPNSAATLKTSAPRQAGMVQQPEGFLDTVAGLIVRLIDRMVSPQTLSLREDERGNLIGHSAADPRHTIGT